jgi:transcriptional regulator with AAA-type ATPase domain
MSADTWATHLLGNGDARLRVPGYRVTVVRGPDKGKEARAQRTDLVVGTQAGSDLQLTDTTVSRNHCAIEARPEGFLLRDLGSTNGTRVGGVRVVEGYVEPGAELDLGETRLRLLAVDAPLEIPLYAGDRFGPMLGASTEMRRLFALLHRAARSDATVLLLGETGTGKDLAAEAIHLASDRASRPFVVIDCSAIPENLIESELFGHERGAFTGAVERRAGAFESAHGGTVFLDEIGELPRAMQPKLLRVLERRVVKPVGANQALQVDVRVVAATNRDLRAEVNRGNFREDLYFRLSVITARMPPLRDRDDDVTLLAESFWRALAPDRPELPSELRERLRAHGWPGNVRELRNAVERAAALGTEFMFAEAEGAASTSGARGGSARALQGGQAARDRALRAAVPRAPAGVDRRQRQRGRAPGGDRSRAPAQAVARARAALIGPGPRRQGAELFGQRAQQPPATSCATSPSGQAAPAARQPGLPGGVAHSHVPPSNAPIWQPIDGTTTRELRQLPQVDSARVSR